MAKTIRARFTLGSLKPLEDVLFPEGKELTIIIKDDEGSALTLQVLKPTFFLKQAGLVSIGGDAVEESRYYDE